MINRVDEAGAENGVIQRPNVRNLTKGTILVASLSFRQESSLFAKKIRRQSCWCMQSDGFGQVVAVGIRRTRNFGSIDKKAWLTVSVTNNIVSERKQHDIILFLSA